MRALLVVAFALLGAPQVFAQTLAGCHVLSVGLPSRASWLAFTVEAIFLLCDRDSTRPWSFTIVCVFPVARS